MSKTLTEKLGTHLPKAIIEKADGKLRYGGRKAGAYRIQRKDPKIGLSIKELRQIVKKVGFQILDIIPPGEEGAASGKFDTYLMRYGQLDFPVVFGQGRNGGQKYEDHVLGILVSSQKAAMKSKARHLLYNELTEAFGVSPKQIYQIKKVATRSVCRPVTKKIVDIGQIVSDIDVELTNGKTIHISLKDLNGSTFANTGYTGGILETSGRNGLPTFSAGSHELDELLDACGVDKTKVVKGLNDYARERMTKGCFKNVDVDFDGKTIVQYLAAAYGYGYWYVRPQRQRRGGGYQIDHISSAKVARAKIGKVTNVLVSYPYWTPNLKSKQVTIKIDTDVARYKIEIRNSHRKIIPNEFKIKVEPPERK